MLTLVGRVMNNICNLLFYPIEGIRFVENISSPSPELETCVFLLILDVCLLVADVDK